ncbi:ABC transporter permease [Xanthobacter autotrophicus]|uniref:ABC transporter permease n=1 Tax=Xanthobacter autotrophicus TaxID=280 RepID=UPI0024A6C7EE|nr:iron ABC transporter permease [Xanthobacter autotrophicus]MDI4658468.1 iron ABC transporter permease [Xanthobacter autotrophicus]
MADAVLIPEPRPARFALPARFSPLLLAAGLVALVVLLPLIALGAIAAEGSGDMWPHLIATVLPNALMETGLLLLGVGLVTLAVAVPCAWLVATCSFPGRAVLEWALLLPLAVPGYIVAFSYLEVLHPLGPVQEALRTVLGIASPRDLRLPDVRSTGGCILVLSVVLYPYVYLSARASFVLQSAAALEVARTLGASRWRAFLKVGLPLARPAIVAGLTLVLLETLGDIGASEFLGVRTLTVSIYTTWVNRSNLPGAAQIALVMLTLVLALILVERAARRAKRFVATGSARPQAPTRLAGLTGLGAALFCAVPVTLGFIVPFVHLSISATRRMVETGFPERIFGEAATTALIALAATTLALSLGLLVTLAQRLTRAPLASGFARLASLGYAVPGTVLAVGLLSPLAGFDNALDHALRQTFGISTGLLISGSGAALVLALAIRFLAIPIGGIEAGYAKLSLHLDMAARSLGSSKPRTVRRIHLPLLRPALATAALLVFVDAMKELPATLLLRPLGLETLATHVYGEAARGTYEDGALAALVILMVGLGPVILLARMSASALRSSAGRARSSSPASSEYASPSGAD